MAVCTILVMIAATEVDSGHPLPFSLTSFIQSIDSTPTFLPCCSHPFFHTYQAHFYHYTSTHPTKPSPTFFTTITIPVFLHPFIFSTLNIIYPFSSYPSLLISTSLLGIPIFSHHHFSSSFTPMFMLFSNGSNHPGHPTTFSLSSFSYPFLATHFIHPSLRSTIPFITDFQTN